MAVSYNKLWKKLIDLEMSRTELRVKSGISTRQLAKLGKNENVTTDVLVRVCQALDCNVADIMDINLFIDPKYSKELGATEDDIKAAIFDSIKVSQAVYDGKVELLGMKGE